MNVPPVDVVGESSLEEGGEAGFELLFVDVLMLWMLREVDDDDG